MTVPRARIGEVLELQRRTVVVKPASEYQEIGVRSFGNGLFLKEPVAGAGLGDKRVFGIARGDLVVSNVFAWEGAVAVADGRHDGKIGSHRFMTWTPYSDTADVGFLRHYFGSDAGLDQLRQASPGSAGRNRTLSIKNFEAIEVPLPSLAEQRRIAAHLDGLGALGQRPPAPRQYFRALKAGVIGRLERSDTVAVPLRGLLSQRSGRAIDRDETYEVSGVYSFGKGLLSRGSIQGHETKYATFVSVAEGDLVYSKLGAFEGAVAVVIPAFAGTHVSPEFPVFARSDRVDAGFLNHVVTSELFEEELRGASTGVGARQKRVHPETFLDLMIPLPGLAEQRRVAAVLDQIDRAWTLTQGRALLESALLPAARNEVFSAMR